ncbi:unnamed protein product [Symbiodinium natans]|uniref:DUF4116 domain-containing protein n=1 Tax=Symbiodinium natans TaxID=878477 RepID=A0A812MC06_9DINO|nr:unnamed protein product [Symbiodinium natans]
MTSCQSLGFLDSWPHLGVGLLGCIGVGGQLSASAPRRSVEILGTSRRSRGHGPMGCVASKDLQADKEVVLAAVKKNGEALRRVSTEFRADKEVVLKAVKQNGFALRYASKDLQADKKVVLGAVKRYGGALREASEDVKADKTVVLKAVKQNGKALSYASEDLQADKEVVLKAVKKNGNALRFASEDLRADKKVVLEAVKKNGAILKLASEDLRGDRGFVLQLVEATKACWLCEFASEELRKDARFKQQCRKTAGTGLVWTYYDNYDMFGTMRSCFSTSGASIPGGDAYGAVMDQLKLATQHGGSATVWFGDTPVWGFATGEGHDRWVHPPEECGRDNVPVPAVEGRSRMWNGVVESRSSRMQPEIGSRHPCWCCHWLREVKRQHDEGKVICCAVSNIFQPEWVRTYGAGSSELSDARAEEFNLTKETFRNGRPEGWGQGTIEIDHVVRTFGYAREAPVHEWTKLPLGEGCRWERQTLDKMNFPVYAFFMP